MAGRNANIGVAITGEADMTAAKRDIKRDMDVIAREGDAAADEIEQAFKTLSPELDTSQIKQALELASKLDQMTASLTVDADISELQDAERLARSLRAFQAKVNLSVEGKAELRDALDLSEQFDRLRKVRLEVEGEAELRKAADLADDLERRRTVPIDAQAADLVRLDNDIADAMTKGGEAGGEGIADALGDVDFADVGSTAADQITGALAAAGPWAAAGGAVAAIFGDEFAEGVNNALPDKMGDTIRQLRNNLSDADLADVGEAGGRAYSAGLSEGLSDAKDAAALIKGELGKVDDDLDLTEVTRQATALERVFGVDLADSVTAVDKLVSQGLVKNSEEGFNLLFELGQQTGTQFDEMLELTNEFSTAIKALGIDGPKGLKLIGDMVEQGIFPQVDQAGEVFEELNETIISGGAHDALQQLGVDADEMTQKIAAGGPEAADAVAAIAGKLLEMDDNAKQAQLTAEIFGGNMGLLGDEAREAALELFATAGATAEVGDSASSAADQIEDSASAIDKLKRRVTDLGQEMAGPLADGLEAFDKLQQGDLTGITDGVQALGQALADRLLGPLGAIGIDPFGPLKDGLRELGVIADEDLPPKLASTIDKVGETADAQDDWNDSLNESYQSVEKLEESLRGMFDFSADQLMRDIAEETDRLAQALADGGAKAVEMSGDIDITTKAGRELEDQLENVNDVLIDAEIAYQNQELSAQQLADVHLSLKSQLQKVGEEAGLTQDQIDVLTQKYLDVPSDIGTELTATDNATPKISALQQALARIKDKSITITATVKAPVGISASAVIGAKARGGWAEGLTLVGEEGPELVEFKGRAFVHTAAETRSLMANDATAAARPAPSDGSGRPFIGNATIVVERGVDLWQQAMLAEQVFRAL